MNGCPSSLVPRVEELRGNMMFESYGLVGSLSDIGALGKDLWVLLAASPLLTHGVNSHSHVQHNSTGLLDLELPKL